MKVIEFNDAGNHMKIQDVFLPKIEFTNQEVIELMCNVNENEIKDLIPIINSINNQGIEEFKLPLTYTRKGKLLSINCLSTAERVYLMSYLAILQKRRVFLMKDLKGFERKTLKEYIDIFKDLDTDNYIYLVGNGDLDIVRYEYYMTGGAIC